MNAIPKTSASTVFEARRDVKKDHPFMVIVLISVVLFLVSLCMAMCGPDLDLGMSAGFY